MDFVGDVAGMVDFSRDFEGLRNLRNERITVRRHDKNSLIAKVFILKYNLPLSIYQQSHLRIFTRFRKICKSCR